MEQFLERLRRIVAQAPLRDAAAVNNTRWALCQRLKATGLDVEVASGGRTKYKPPAWGMSTGWGAGNNPYWVSTRQLPAHTPDETRIFAWHPDLQQKRLRIWDRGLGGSCRPHGQDSGHVPGPRRQPR